MSDHPEDGVPPIDVDATKPQPETHHPSRTIGAYRLLQLVGEGGMGEVWLAEQTHPVRRQVALKVIKAGMDTAQVVTLYERWGKPDRAAEWRAKMPKPAAPAPVR